MHAGRSAKARKAALSHTGALIGDFATMRTQVEDAGAIVVTTMDEMMDLVRYPGALSRTARERARHSHRLGRVCGTDATISPRSSASSFPSSSRPPLKRVNEVLPAYGNYGNPLDVTAGFAPDSLSVAAKALLDDPNIGMLFISFPINAGLVLQSFNKGMAGSSKPKVMVALGDTWPLGPDVMEAVKQSPAVFSRSSDRMLRAIALYTRYGRLLARPRAGASPEPIKGLPRLGKGAQPEWLGKKVLAAAGIRVPDGELARTADEAVAVARRIGYPGGA